MFGSKPSGLSHATSKHEQIKSLSWCSISTATVLYHNITMALSRDFGPRASVSTRSSYACMRVESWNTREPSPEKKAPSVSKSPSAVTLATPPKARPSLDIGPAQDKESTVIEDIEREFLAESRGEDAITVGHKECNPIQSLTQPAGISRLCRYL